MFSRTVLLMAMVITALLIAPLSAIAADKFSPEQLVAEFQKVPHYEMFCEDENRKGAEPNKVREKFKTYFSKELFRLFMWSQCFEPDTPNHYGGLNSMFYYDIRNALPSRVDDLKLRVHLPKYQGRDRAIVKVNYWGDIKLFSIYTLILEDGQWKIDDIAPQGDYIKNPKNDAEYWHNDGALDHSDSIKTDMQNNYRAAEKRHQEEQAKKR